MERTIKFRGKRTDNGEWVYGYFFKSWDNCYILHGTVNGVPVMVEVIPETIGQLTGLKDKDDKKVYEGDILYEKYDDELEDNGCGEVYYEVVFKDGSFGFMGETTDQFWTFCYNPITTEIVISNIYDNPELIKRLDNGI